MRLQSLQKASQIRRRRKDRFSQVLPLKIYVPKDFDLRRLKRVRFEGLTLWMYHQRSMSLPRRLWIYRRLQEHMMRCAIPQVSPNNKTVVRRGISWLFGALKCKTAPIIGSMAPYHSWTLVKFHLKIKSAWKCLKGLQHSIMGLPLLLGLSITLPNARRMILWQPLVWWWIITAQP